MNSNIENSIALMEQYITKTDPENLEKYKSGDIDFAVTLIQKIDSVEILLLPEDTRADFTEMVLLSLIGNGILPDKKEDVIKCLDKWSETIKDPELKGVREILERSKGELNEDSFVDLIKISCTLEGNLSVLVTAMMGMMLKINTDEDCEDITEDEMIKSTDELSQFMESIFT